MPDIDYVVELAAGHGWTVDDRRRIGILWFTRGAEYAHLSTTAHGGRVLSAYGGVQGRASRFWATPRHDEIAEHLAAAPYRFTD